jgi:hypothetical protein
MNDLYLMSPVNKIAAIVTNQAGCGDGALTSEQERDNLVTKWKALQAEMLSLPKGSMRRKRKGKRLCELQEQINAIRPKAKARGVEGYFVDVCREDMQKPQFDILMRKAADRLRADEIRSRINTLEE